MNDKTCFEDDYNDAENPISLDYALKIIKLSTMVIENPLYINAIKKIQYALTSNGILCDDNKSIEDVVGEYRQLLQKI